MIIAEKLENDYNILIEIIKNEKNRIAKMKMIGSLVMDIGGRCISAISRKVECSRKFVKKVFYLYKTIVENNYHWNLEVEKS